METAKPNGGWSWSDERVGDALAVAAGLGFLLVCMFLPLVGPAAARGSGSPGASRAPYYALSYATFLIVLLLTFALGAGAAGSKVLRRRDVGGGLPWVSLGLCGACFVLLVALLAGALQV
jgi:hypothetical protein